jgi:glycine/D-amino acid oxidase-like deaminating enzyme
MVGRDRLRVGVIGAGIYGSTVAIRLAQEGYDVRLLDPLGVMQAASAINQYRVHSGYHYPRSFDTMTEILEARTEFATTFEAAIVRSALHYYAIPREGSRTTPDQYEAVMREHGLPLTPCRPEWMNFDFIDRCYEVDEQIYDPDILRRVIQDRIDAAGVKFIQEAYRPEMRREFDSVVFATYGLGPSQGHFPIARFQIAEKILIELPAHLTPVSLVVVDGPFTAWDPYGASGHSMFGSAKNTNHWSSTDPDEEPPERYRGLLNRPTFEPVAFTHFEKMRADATDVAPDVADAKYLGSRFTMRVVEDSPDDDRRVLYVEAGEPGELHIFSGKVVGAVKAARLVCEQLAAYA